MKKQDEKKKNPLMQHLFFLSPKGKSTILLCLGM